MAPRCCYRDVSTGLIQFYIDGVLEASATGSLNSLTAPTQLTMGILQTGAGTYFNGQLDEVRIFGSVLASANIQTDCLTPSISSPGTLALYYNLDEGTAGGNNAGITTAFDQPHTNDSTLNNFALTGTTSNWVESYAQVVPTATAATAITTSFIASWTAPTVGIVDNYFLDVSTNAAFTAPISGSPFTVAVGTTSRSVTGVAPGTTYYYRVRANKALVVPNQGGPSNVITVTTPSTVSTLSNLVLSAGPISPVFASGTLSYTLTVPSTTASTTVTPTVTQAGATVKVNGTTVASGTASVAIALAAGANTTITVLVTAQDGVTQTAYTVVVTRCAVTAVAQNVTVPLASNGIATVLASAVNNSSASNCGTVTPEIRKIVSVQAPEDGNLTLTAPAGMVFTAVTFASYGTPTLNANGTYSIGGCHATNSQTIVEGYLLGQNMATIPASNSIFGDPCNGTFKSLVVQAVYGPALTQFTYSCAEVGSNLVLLTLSDASGTTATTIATVTVTVPATPTTTWTGAASADWTACQNWSFGKVPDATTSAIIPSGLATYPNLTAGTLTVLNLTINNGASFTLGSGATLDNERRLHQQWYGQPDRHRGLCGQHRYPDGGLPATPFTTVTVNKGSGSVQLASNLAIGTALNVTSGTLITTSSYQLQLGASATISETETSYVLGKVTLTRTVASGTAQSFGGMALR